MAEQVPRRRLAVLIEHDLVVLHRPHPPATDLLAGQVREDEFLLLVDVVDDRLSLDPVVPAPDRGTGSRPSRVESGQVPAQLVKVALVRAL